MQQVLLGQKLVQLGLVHPAGPIIGGATRPRLSTTTHIAHLCPGTTTQVAHPHPWTTRPPVPYPGGSGPGRPPATAKVVRIRAVSAPDAISS